MNLYRLIRIFYHKIVFLVLSKFATYSQPKLDYDHSIKNNLILFTLDSFDFTDFKTLLLNFNDSKGIFVDDFVDTPKSFLCLFNSEGILFAQYTFNIYKPFSEKTELGFDNFVIYLINEIIKDCIYEAMNNNISEKYSKFYMHISNENIIIEK